MPSDSEWGDGTSVKCSDDGVPDGVPVYGLMDLDGYYVGQYCRLHAAKRTRELAMIRRAATSAAHEEPAP
jgi:hypothetical protein